MVLKWLSRRPIVAPQHQNPPRLVAHNLSIFAELYINHFFSEALCIQTLVDEHDGPRT